MSSQLELPAHVLTPLWPESVFCVPLRISWFAMAAGYQRLADVQAVLVISQPWSDMIRSGFKTMELRSSSFRKYEGQWIGLATSGSGALWGAARISKSTLLNEQTMYAPELFSQHRVAREEIARLRAGRAAAGSRSPWKKIYGLSLDGLVTFPQPLPYKHTRGAIGVVRLLDNEVFKRARAHVLAQQMTAAPLQQAGPNQDHIGSVRPLVRCRLE